MQHELLQRKLTTILVADVVSYSRMVSEDDERAISGLKKCRIEIDKIIYSVGGRIFSTGGDSVLAEFPSTVNAVRAATAMQDFLKVFNSEKIEGQKFEYRIGVHVGEVIIDGTDLLGDGVNIAARLAGVCRPGNVWISSSALEFIQKQAEFKFESEGKQSVKNIPDPVEAYSVINVWRGQEERLLTSCRRMFESQLNKSTLKMFQQVSEALFEVVLESSGDQKNTYVKAIEALEEKKLDLEKSFCDGFLRTIDERLKSDSPSESTIDLASIDVSDLDLLGKEEEEQIFSLNYIAEKINSACHNEIFELDNRISALVGTAGFAGDDNPFGPRSFSEASRAACDQLELDITSKTLILRVLAIKLSPIAKEIYGEINTFLVTEGVLPTIRPLVVSGAPGAGAFDQGTGQATNIETPVAAIAAPTDVVTHQQLHEMVGQLISTGQLAPSDFAHLAKNRVSDKALTVLNQAQQEEVVSTPPENIGPGQFSESNVNILHSLKASPISEELDSINAEILSVVAAMFDLILDDEDISERIKALVGRLQIPILKVTLIDKTFFSEEGHPAKELLNTIVTASTDLIDDDWQEVLYAKVKDIVSRIIKEFSDDIQIFVETGDELNKFISGERREARLEEAETAQAIENQELAVLAQRKTNAVVEQRLKRSTPARFIHDFIRDHWGGLLMLTYMKEGETGNEWRTYIDTLDDLLWSVSSERTGDDKRRLISLIPNLVSNLKKGMDAVDLGTEIKGPFLSFLKKEHIRTIQLEQNGKEFVDEDSRVFQEAEGKDNDDTEHRFMAEAIKFVNESVFCTATTREDCDGMLTTLVALQSFNDRIVFAHVGDSRLYLFRNKELSQLTVDHTVEEFLLNRGYSDPSTGLQGLPDHILSRSIGGEKDLEVETQELKIADGDLLIACSDGFYSAIEDHNLAEMLSNGKGDLGELAQALVDDAVSADGRDNATVGLMSISQNLLESFFGCATDGGKTRSHNEDYVLVNKENGIVVLAGGMGGGKRGQVASHLACNLLLEILKAGDLKEFKKTYVSGGGNGNLVMDVEQLYSDFSDINSEEESLNEINPFEEFESKWSGELEEIEVTGLGDLFDTPEDKYLRLASSLKVGSWVEFRSSGGAVTRARVSWLSPRTSAVLFTDVRGVKVSAPSLKSLADEFRRGSARVVGVPIVNRIANYIRHLGHGNVGLEA